MSHYISGKAVADFDKTMQSIGGCSDGYCVITGKATGQHTNGGCRCSNGLNKMQAQQFMRAARRLRDAVFGI